MREAGRGVLPVWDAHVGTSNTNTHMCSLRCTLTPTHSHTHTCAHTSVHTHTRTCGLLTHAHVCSHSHIHVLTLIHSHTTLISAHVCSHAHIPTNAQVSSHLHTSMLTHTCAHPHTQPTILKSQLAFTQGAPEHRLVAGSFRLPRKFDISGLSARKLSPSSLLQALGT